MKEINAYRLPDRTCPFQDWHKKITDKNIKVAIGDRVRRAALGNLGDWSSVGEGVYELRLHSGPGYRIYFAYDGDTIIMLLVGGDKSTQVIDIKKAKLYFADYKRRKAK